MDSESDLEKTEQPSQRRLDQAREEGQVARSRELSTFMALLAGGGGLWFMGEHMRQSLLKLVRQGLSFDAGVATDPVRMMERFSRLSLETVEVFLPFLGLLLITAIFSPLLLNGWLFSFKPLQPNFSRLDPLAGIGRMFSAQGGVELVKSIAKAVVVGGAGIWAVWHYLDQTLMLPALSIPSATLQMGTLVGQSFLAMLAGMMLVQRWMCLSLWSTIVTMLTQ
ncbi:flagellar biosynthetic protein FlhB, partial [mine drainage metagenome]